MEIWRWKILSLSSLIKSDFEVNINETSLSIHKEHTDLFRDLELDRYFILDFSLPLTVSNYPQSNISDFLSSPFGVLKEALFELIRYFF